MKSEPNVYSIDDLEREKTTIWDGVRNYQARNYLQQMLFFITLTVPPPQLWV